MIHKTRGQPSEIAGLTALLSRLRHNSPLREEISSDLSSRASGIRVARSDSMKC